MTRSTSSESDRSHSSRHHSDHKKKKKKKKSRRRSRSSSSDRHSSQHRSHHSDKHKERRRERSKDHSRDRSRDRSREKSRNSSRDRSNRSSPNRSRENKGRRRSGKSISDAESLSASDIDKKMERLDHEDEGTPKVDINAFLEEEQDNKPTIDQLEELEDGSFVQQSFKSTSDAFKKKKKKKKQRIVSETSVDNDATIHVSHENAIFGTTNETMHVTKFGPKKEIAKTIDSEESSQLSELVDDDVLFGPMFSEDPQVRMKRWIEKLKELRGSILGELDEVKKEDMSE